MVSLVIAFIALGVAVREALIRGDYQSILSHQTLTPFITTGFAVVGALVASRHPRNPIGWIFVAVGMLYALLGLLAAMIVHGPTSSPIYLWANWLGSWLWIPALFLPTTFVLLIFPDGHVPSPRWRFAAWSVTLGLAMTILAVMLHPGPLAALNLKTNPLGIPGAAPVLDQLLNVGLVFLAMGFIGSLAAVLVRFRRSADIEREQMKWLVYAVGINALGFVLSGAAWFFWPDYPWKGEISIAVSNLSILGIAVAAAIAILRYRLFDIEILINRTLVYGALTGVVAGVYVLIVGGLSMLLQSRGSLALSLFGVGMVAVMVQPLRDRLQRTANRLMYGERDDPYAALSRLGQRLEGTIAPEAVLPNIVEAVAQTLKLPYAAIALARASDASSAMEAFPTVAAYGSPTPDPLRLPLIYQAETIGALVVGPRAGETFSSADRRLLADLARQAGVAVHAVRLTADLKRSREKLVTAREEERRRLRRDLHDGLGPQLASLTLRLETAGNRLAHDRDAQALLAELAAQAAATVADIRRLVYALRPPTLDELGLVNALREAAAQYPPSGLGVVSILIEAPEDLPPLPAAVEVAAYRIAQEAMTNVVRHAGARQCVVRLGVNRTEGWLCLEIRDDGRGLPIMARQGVGLNSMRERAEELGGDWTIESAPQGGTRIEARLPYRMLSPLEETKSQDAGLTGREG